MPAGRHRARHSDASTAVFRIGETCRSGACPARVQLLARSNPRGHAQRHVATLAKTRQLGFDDDGLPARIGPRVQGLARLMCAGLLPAHMLNQNSPTLRIPFDSQKDGQALEIIVFDLGQFANAVDHCIRPFGQNQNELSPEPRTNVGAVVGRAARLEKSRDQRCSSGQRCAVPRLLQVASAHGRPHEPSSLEVIAYCRFGQRPSSDRPKC